MTQTDLPPGSRSGLREAHELLREIDGVAFEIFTHADGCATLSAEDRSRMDQRDARLQEQRLRPADPVSNSKIE